MLYAFFWVITRRLDFKSLLFGVKITAYYSYFQPSCGNDVCLSVCTSYPN